MLPFRVFGFDVQIHLSFLILVFFVLDSGLSGAGVALWVVAAFLSVLIHEFGHALTARGFGAQVQSITIYAMGGVTTWRDVGRMGGLRRFLVAAAGSGLEIIVALGLFGLVKAGVFGELAKLTMSTPWQVELGFLDFQQEYLLFFIGTFVWVSVVWGLINWLPVGGLDGSRMLREMLVRFLGPRGAFHASVIGLVVAVAAAAWFWQNGYRFAPFIFLFFAISDFSRLRNPRG